jgi:threonine synthase
VSNYRGVKVLRECGGVALTFAEDTLKRAIAALAHEGLWQEYSGVAGLAALYEAHRRGQTFEEPIVVILTSSGFKDIPTSDAEPRMSSAEDIAATIARLRAVNAC